MTCRLATALRHKEGLHKYMGTAWIIASGKGGVGKSTLSVCLGMEIARGGGVAWGVGIGAHADIAELIGPGQQLAETVIERRGQHFGRSR